MSFENQEAGSHAGAAQSRSSSSAHHPMMVYETPLGTFGDWEQAAAACDRADLDPCTCITNRQVSVPSTCIEHAYGSAYRLSFQIKVF